MDSIVNLTVGKIGELLLQEAKLLHDVEDEVESMQKELIMMNNFLIDMEALDDESCDERLRETVKQIRRIAYDAEDVIDSYILGGINPAENKKDFFKRYLSFCECLVNTHKAGAEIEVIKTKIIRTMETLKRYRGESGLTTDVGKGTNKTKVWRPAVYAHTKEDHVVGRKEDIERLVGLLTTKSNETEIQVLSIVGMGGSGKTTLVRKLFNHESVKQCFDTMTWVPISKQWVVQTGLLYIFKKTSGVNVPSDEAQGTQDVGEKIHEYLEKRKYLIVLDDVWTNRALEEILATLPMGKNGSKIIVTTRFRDVVVGDPNLKVYIHEPRELTAEESWELFRKIAFKDAEDVELKELGEEMLKKCKGLPLAIVALAGVLAKKKTLEEWEKVNMAMSSRLMEAGRGTQTYGPVNEALSLSYNDLPQELKPCFLYLGLFPEDAEIPVGMLIRMWIAEGFISSKDLHERETLEDLGRGYMNELIGRCVVRVAKRNYEGKAKSIEIHDLMRDLCIKKAKELDFLETVSIGSSDRDKRVSQTRRTVVHSYNDKVFCHLLSDNRHLRSLFLSATPVVGYYFYVAYYGERAQLSILPILENFRLLRVLILVGIIISEGTLPKEIGSLILLRYLGLMGTNITQLPSSIGNLRNLLTLDYRNFPFNEGYAKVPNALWEIEGLRHIYLPCDPQEGTRFDTLHQLQTLWVEGAGSWMLDELPKLSESVQKLRIEGITSSEQLEVVFRCPSIKFDRLRSLVLQWDTEREDEGESGAEKETVLNNLEAFCHFSKNNRHLRSLFLFATPNFGYLYRAYHVKRIQLSLLPILKNFKLLRVLNLVAIDTSDGTLPKEIGSLILLRYLGLRLTNIIELPSSIRNLRNLLTLDYRGVNNLEKEPKISNVLWEIEGLRHIYLPCDPQEGTRFDTLHQLQTLWVQGADSWITDELPKLSKGVQKLRIHGIRSNEQLEVVFRCPSIKFDRLHSLALSWHTDRGGESEDEGVGEEETVLKNLECIVNSRHLRKLVLEGRIDDRSACFQFPFGIKKLSLGSTRIEEEATLEALGRLPSLKFLFLSSDSYIGTKWTCYEGLFSQLNVLWIIDLPKLEEWSIEKGAMCPLNKLHIVHCKRLIGLPEGLKSVTTLKELELELMEPGFYRKIRQEDREDAHIIQHIPVVKFGAEIASCIDKAINLIGDDACNSYASNE